MVHFFAACTLHYKICMHWYDLTPDSQLSLKSSLWHYIHQFFRFSYQDLLFQRYINAPFWLVKRVSLTFAALVARLESWQNIVQDILNGLCTCSASNYTKC